MAAVELTPDDLAPFADIPPAKAEAMIEDALAQALLVAPCITDDAFALAAAAKSILRGAVLRWHDAGNGAVQQATAGPFGQTVDTRQARRGMFWPSEIEQLQKLCRAVTDNGIFSVDTAGLAGGGHALICSANFGAAYCSCGADISGGYPLYEVDI